VRCRPWWDWPCWAGILCGLEHGHRMNAAAFASISAGGSGRTACR
jgi:hypothetical protein